MRKLTYVELSPDVKGYKPKVGDASVGAPLDSELFQERIKRAHSRIQRGGKTLKALAWKSALNPQCGLTRFTQEFLVTLLVLRVVKELT